MTEHALGIDLGTSGVKAGLLNLATLKLECISTRRYPGDAEQDPEILWGRTVEAARKAVSLMDRPGVVRTIGLSGQMHGVVLYDGAGRLVGPLINWQDQKWSPRAVIEKMKLVMGDAAYEELGTELSSGYSGAILFGIKEREPGLFRQIAHFMLPVDFLRGRILGESDLATDQTNAFGTGLFDTRSNRWHAELIAKLHLPAHIFPEVHASSQIAGGMCAQTARLLGLEANIPVIYGGGDNQMSMLGSTLARPGSPILLNIGTAGQISKVVAEFERFPGLETRSFFDGAYALVGTSLGGGGSYQWLRDRIRRAQGVDLDYPELDRLAEGVPPGADGLIFSTGPTRQNPDRPRGFFGNTGKGGSTGHRARAVLEGVLMDLYASYEMLTKGDSRESFLGAGKGLQQSQVWSKIAADLFGKTLRRTGFEGAVYGAALMAAHGVGAVEDLGKAVRAIDVTHETAPDPKAAEFYRDKFVPFWRTVVRQL